MFPPSGTLIACVSGGADSMCLLAVLADITKERGLALVAAHYNHKLRGDESDRDENLVRDYCAKIGIPFRSDSGDVKAFARAKGLGIEEAAREMRYAFFQLIAAQMHDTARQNCDTALQGRDTARIVTAHTADDNAETILMNLVRGAGATGISGIPPKRGIIVRPMLRVSREEVIQYLSERSIQYAEDSTNSLDIYTRNKLRHNVIPILKEINPRFLDTAAVAAELASADDEFIVELADAFIAGLADQKTPEAAALAALPFAVSSRVIRKLAAASLSHKHVESVLKLCHREGPPASLSLPGLTVYVEYGKVLFLKNDNSDSGQKGFEPIVLEYEAVDGNAAFDSIEIPQRNKAIFGLQISCKKVLCTQIHKSFTTFLFKKEDLCGKITVRPRREGDSIRLSAKSGAKTLKKLFIERRIPARKRASIPVIADDEGVLAVYGIGAGIRAAPAEGDIAIQIEFQKGVPDA